MSEDLIEVIAKLEADSQPKQEREEKELTQQKPPKKKIEMLDPFGNDNYTVDVSEQKPNPSEPSAFTPEHLASKAREIRQETGRKKQTDTLSELRTQIEAEIELNKTAEKREYTSAWVDALYWVLSRMTQLDSAQTAKKEETAK